MQSYVQFFYCYMWLTGIEGMWNAIYIDIYYLTLTVWHYIFSTLNTINDRLSTRGCSLVALRK